MLTQQVARKRYARHLDDACASVNTTWPTISQTGKRRQLMVLHANRAFLHADALTETYVKPPHFRDTKRCWRLMKCIYGLLFIAAGWQHLVQKVDADIGMLWSVCMRARIPSVGHGLYMVTV